MHEPSATPVQIFLFGNPRIILRGNVLRVGRRKALALLVYLALTNKPVGRSVIATILSPDLDNERSNADLRRALAVLNKVGLDPYLAADRDTIEFRRGADVWIDAREFDRLLKPPATADAMHAAIDLYRDELMAGFTLRGSTTFEEWHFAQQQHYQQKYMAALEKLVQIYMQQQTYEPAFPILERWMAANSFDEQAHRQAMQLYVLAGQGLTAQRIYENYAQRLRTEMGVEPQRETMQLYEEIRAGSGFIPQAVAQIANKLPPRPSLVLGRDDALRDLKSLLSVPKAGPVVLQGWPGIGKTTVSALLAHDPEIHAAFPDGVLWVSLGQFPNTLAELKVWAEVAGLTLTEDVETVEQVSARLRARFRDSKMLLIVDDVWSAGEFMPFAVGGSTCAVLVSTRANDVARSIAGIPERIYKLPILDETRSLELLKQLAYDAVDQNQDAIRELVRDLEGLPLALQVAGRLLWAEHSMGWGVEELLADLREGTRLLNTQSPADRIEFVQDVPPTIAVLLRRSTDRLDTETRQYFALLGVFAPKPATFALEALEAVWDVPNAKPIARVLVDRGLMEPTDGVFQIHALLVAHARTLFAAE